jgi:hypothetical protein
MSLSSNIVSASTPSSMFEVHIWSLNFVSVAKSCVFFYVLIEQQKSNLWDLCFFIVWVHWIQSFSSQVCLIQWVISFRCWVIFNLLVQSKLIPRFLALQICSSVSSLNPKLFISSVSYSMSDLLLMLGNFQSLSSIKTYIEVFGFANM